MKGISIYKKNINVYNMLIFTFPTIIMLVFTSIYSMIDGIVVARFVGSRALSSINIVYPLISMVSGLGFMISAGGSAVAARKMGENKQAEANSFFTSLIVLIIVIGILLTVLSVVFSKPIYTILGADENLISFCMTYGNIMMCGVTLFMLQIIFQMFFVTAGRPITGLILTVASGVTNMILDFLLVGAFDMGVKGAALATVTSYFIGGILPFFWFSSKKMTLRLKKPVFNAKLIAESMANGASEMVTSIAASITTFLFNIKMMNLVGEKGVAAITSILYIQFLFSAVLLGFTSGIAPIISYNYGAKNHENLKKLFRICIKTTFVTSVIMFICAEAFSSPIIHIFSGDDKVMSSLAVRGLRIFSISFLLCGFNIFGSGFFTSLCNGKISACISLFRTLLLEAPFIVILPYFIGVEGIWWAVPISEALCLVYSASMLITNKKRYNY